MEYIAECQFTNGPYAQLMNEAFNSAYTIQRNYSSCILTITSLKYDLSGTYICKEMYAETNFVTHNVSCTDIANTGRETSGLLIGLIIDPAIALFVIVVIVVLMCTRTIRCTNDRQNRAERVSEENTSINHSENLGMSLNNTHNSTSYHFDQTGRLESKSHSPQKQGFGRLEPVCDSSRSYTVFDEKMESEEMDNTHFLGVNEDTVDGNETVNKPVDNTDAPTCTLTKELLEEIQKQDAARYNSVGMQDVTEQEINHEDICTSPPQRFLNQTKFDNRKELQELSDRKLITKGGDQ